jgi:hypothetical protein
MAPPDLNSLPPSRSVSSSPIQIRNMPSTHNVPNRNDTPSPRSSSTSLAATAVTNAANGSRRSSLSNRGSPRLGRMPSDRRRSQVAIGLNLNDPTIPSPGELSSSDPRSSSIHSHVAASPTHIGGRPAVATGDPHHQRQPSLGEIHNEFEQEQEAQVNRMLHLIREQQLQLDALRNSQTQNGTHSRQTSQPAVLDDETPVSERSITFPSIHPAVPAVPPIGRRISRGPSSASRSPALRPLAGHDSSTDNWPPSPVESVTAAARRNSFRDETAYYQAETNNLTRENQMLRLRIRELERQISDLNSSPRNTPAIHSNLASPGAINAAEAEALGAAAVARITTEPEKV